MSWWDSLESVNRFNVAMQVLAVALAIFTSIATAASIVAARRASTLQDAKTQQDDKAAEAEKQQLREDLAKTGETARAATAQLKAQRKAEEAAEALRRTPPKIEAGLAFFRDNRLHAVVDSLTTVPFEHQWVIVTTKDILVTGFPLEWTKTYPAKGSQRFNQLVDPINFEKIVDGYIELRFEYRSLYAAELGLTELSGSIVKKYRVDFPSLTLVEL